MTICYLIVVLRFSCGQQNKFQELVTGCDLIPPHEFMTQNYTYLWEKNG